MHCHDRVTPGVCLGIELTVRLDLDNEPQADIILRLEETVGGETDITADGYLQGEIDQGLATLQSDLNTSDHQRCVQTLTDRQ